MALKPAWTDEDFNLLVGSFLLILKPCHEDKQGESPLLSPTTKCTSMSGILILPLKTGKKKVSIFVFMIGKTKLLACDRKNKDAL